jgi:hypothetical protein
MLVLMRKLFLTASAIVAMVTASFAQTGKNQIGIGAELGVATASGGGTIVGLTGKYLHGIGTAGQVTLTTGALFHSESETDPDFGKASATLRQIPVLFGYRHNFNGLYVEPQLGYMSSHVSVKANGEKLFSGSSGSFAFAIGGGYALTNGLDFGVSYRKPTETGSSGYLAFRIGYNLSLLGSSGK